MERCGEGSDRCCGGGDGIVCKVTRCFWWLVGGVYASSPSLSLFQVSLGWIWKQVIMCDISDYRDSNHNCHRTASTTTLDSDPDATAALGYKWGCRTGHQPRRVCVGACTVDFVGSGFWWWCWERRCDGLIGGEEFGEAVSGVYFGGRLRWVIGCSWWMVSGFGLIMGFMSIIESCIAQWAMQREKAKPFKPPTPF